MNQPNVFVTPAWIALVLGGLAVAFLLTGFPFASDYTRGRELGVLPDVLHEQATAEEALSGDPYRPISELMPERGYSEMQGGVSPRTPAALLLQVPLVLIPQAALMPLITTLILILVAVALWLTHRIARVEWKWVAWASPVVYFSYPVVTAITYGSVSVVSMTVLILMAWAFQEESWSGVPLGIAAAMRLWPGLVIVGFWIAGRRRAAYVAATVFLATNLLGLLLPGVTLEGTMSVILGGAGDWVNHNQNASLAAFLDAWGLPIALPTLVMSGVSIWLAWRNPSEAIPLCVLGGLVASPLSWPAYLLVTMPILAMWWTDGGRVPVALIGAAFLLWPFTPTSAKGLLALIALVAMFVHVSRQHPPDRATPHPPLPA